MAIFVLFLIILTITFGLLPRFGKSKLIGKLRGLFYLEYSACVQIFDALHLL